MYDTDKINALPILDVAERLGVEVRKKGARYMACCLWHQDAHPSMQIGGRKNICHCYSCGETHGVIDLVMKHESTDFLGACRWLENQGWDVAEATAKTERKTWLERQEALMARPRRMIGKTEVADDVKMFDIEFLEGKMTMENSFVRCLKTVFGYDVALDVVYTYWLCSIEGREGYPNVMFPLIDYRGKVRDVKVQGYECDERSERFFHGNGCCYWLGPTLDRDAVFDRNCLFGEHLLRRNPDKAVVLVESPKNACVGYAECPDYLWLATGNKNMLKREVLEVLRGRTVVVYPDNDAYDEWKAKLDEMQDVAVFKTIRMENAEGKEDIADVIIRNTWW